MRDFFNHQDVARRNSLKLIIFFSLAALLVVVLVSSAIYILLSFNPQRLYHSTSPFDLTPATWNYQLWGRIAAGVLAFILLGTFYKYMQLKSGGGALVAQMCGGRPVMPDTDNLLERRLLNIVEEMALASGVTVPTVYLLEREGGINAFAAGFSQEDAVIGVTRGALTYLDREELQGVVAHEFSHILHGDMLVNLRLQGVLHGILSLGLLGEVLLRGSARGAGTARVPYLRGGRQGSGAAAFLLGAGVVLYVLGYVGALAGRLVKSAIVRQREFLADASAVQFTRNPGGLAGALKKVGGYSGGSRIVDLRAAEISHLYFENALSGRRWSWLSTHPPLLERIRRLEPGFKGEFPRRMQPVAVAGDEAALSLAPAGVGRRPLGGTPLAAGLFWRPPRPGSQAEGEYLQALLAGPSPQHLLWARELIASLPGAVRGAARNPFSARAVVYGLLLDQEEGVRKAQLAHLKRTADPAVWQELGRLHREIVAVGPELRLPLLDLLLPALKTLSDEQYRRFRQNVQALIAANRQVDIFEFALQYLLLKRLDRHFEPGAQPQPPEDPLPPMGRWEQVSCVLSMLARHGHPEEREARRSFMRGVRHFGPEMKFLEYLPDQLCTLRHFAAALEGLDQAEAQLKETLMTAALATIIHDGVVTIREAELLRTMAEALRIPAPPWLAPGRETDQTR